MSWIKLDDSLPDNAKIEGLSDRAFRLYVYGLCLCGRKLTDGTITNKDAMVLRSQAQATKRHVEELEAAGLWVRENGHRVVNDYLDYNPTKAKALEDKEKARERMRVLRSKERSGERDNERSPEGSTTPYPFLEPKDQNHGSNDQNLEHLRALQARIGRTIE